MRCLPSIRRFEGPDRVWPETAKLFDSFFRDFPLSGLGFEREAGTPAVDIIEKDNNLILRAELPGMEEKEIQLALDGNVLTLKGERKLQDEDKRDNYYRIESFHGSFSRSFSLPETVDKDKIKAEYKNGVLTITIPQKPESKTRAIPVNAH